MRSMPGLRQLVACDAGTLATTPANALAFGYRSKTALKITEFKNTADYLERSLRNKVNFNVSGESFQGTMQMLSRMLSWANLNADIQMITNKQSASASSDDVFKFTGDNKLGIGFEFVMNDEKRSLTPTFEGALEYDNAVTLIDSADSETAVDFGLSNAEGIDETAYRYPFYISFESPKTTAVFSKADIQSREFKMTLEGQKDAYNKLVAQYLKLEISITGFEATISKVVEQMNKNMSSSILWKEQNGADSSLYAGIDIAEGVLHQTNEFTIDDENRILVAKYVGKIPLYEHSFLFGTGNGGAAEDTTGATGGTIKIGY